MTMYAQLPFFLRRMLALQAVLLFFMFTFSEVKLLEQRRKAAFFVPLLRATISWPPETFLPRCPAVCWPSCPWQACFSAGTS